MTELTLDELGDFFVVGGVADQLGVLFVDELVHELRQIASTHRDLCDRVGDSVSFVDGDRVRDALPESSTVPVVRPIANKDITAWLPR